MSDSTKNTRLAANGWTAVPRSFTKSLADVDKNKQAELVTDGVKPPSSEIAKKTYEFAKEQLPEKTFNHSMRVWYYGKYKSFVSKIDCIVYTSVPVDGKYCISPKRRRRLDSFLGLLTTLRTRHRAHTLPTPHTCSRNLLPDMPTP
jgi:hypothetical protein